MRLLPRWFSSIAIVACFVFPVQSLAADVHEVVEHRELNYIAVDGVLAKGDFAKVVALANSFVKRGRPIRLLLNSDGGDVAEAMKIGRFVKSTFATVKIKGSYVTPKAPALRRCYSACVLIMVAAAVRDHEMDNEFFTDNGNGVWETIDGKPQLKSVPVLGIQRPYYDKEAYKLLNPDQARRQYATLENAIRQYLKEMGAPDSFVDEMFRYSSNEVKLISKSEFIRVFGYNAPFLEEWFLANCGDLSSKELSDFGKIAGDRIVRGDDSYTSKEFSPGYADYLMNKQREVQACKEKKLQDHQKSAIGKAEKS